MGVTQSRVYSTQKGPVMKKALPCHDFVYPLQWRHNGRDSVSNRQPHDCFLNRLFRHRSKKTSNLRVTGLCAGNSSEAGDSPHKWPVTQKMFPFDGVTCCVFTVLHKMAFTHNSMRNELYSIYNKSHGVYIRLPYCCVCCSEWFLPSYFRITLLTRSDHAVLASEAISGNMSCEPMAVYKNKNKWEHLIGCTYQIQIQIQKRLIETHRHIQQWYIRSLYNSKHSLEIVPMGTPRDNSATITPKRRCDVVLRDCPRLWI